MVKKRTLNELRQEKEYGYKQPKTISNYYKVVNFDCQYVVDLIKKYPNNMELGMEIRNYYESLK
jgi:hypothetical protein